MNKSIIHHGSFCTSRFATDRRASFKLSLLSESDTAIVCNIRAHLNSVQSIIW